MDLEYAPYYTKEDTVILIREWMCICFELLHLLMAHKKGHPARGRQTRWLHCEKFGTAGRSLSVPAQETWACRRLQSRICSAGSDRDCGGGRVGHSCAYRRS